MPENDAPTYETEPANVGQPENEPTLFASAVSSYAMEYSVADLCTQIDTESVVRADYQRAYVWKAEQASRLIESIVFSLPIPMIFLAVDPANSSRKIIVDGIQRLLSIHGFRKGQFPGSTQRFVLTEVDPALHGKTYLDLDPEQRYTIDSTMIPAMVMKPSGDMSAYRKNLFQVYDRLNSGGSKLTPQEIRNWVYHGEFSTALLRISQIGSWGQLYGQRSLRMRDQELILRCWALYRQGDLYSEPMKSFLSSFMDGIVSNSESNECIALREQFTRAADMLAIPELRDHLRPAGRRNACSIELAILSALFHPTESARVLAWIQHENYRDTIRENATSSVDDVRVRISHAKMLPGV